MKIEFKNGSTIKSIANEKTEVENIRGGRSELWSFYCVLCRKMHTYYPIKDTVIIREKNMMVCKESAEEMTK